MIYIILVSTSQQHLQRQVQGLQQDANNQV
jgi:hypothetical protein